VRARCPACNGEGAQVRPSDVCGTCRGQRIVKDRKVLEVHIERGAKKGDHIRFTGEGDQVPGVALSGDILILLEQKPHDVFRRVGNHLLMNHTLTLQEALLGVELPIEHLDRRVVVVTIPPGDVVDPGFAYVVHREGMPVPNTGGSERGNLIIYFEVTFPTAPLGAAALKLVGEALNHTPAAASSSAAAGGKKPVDVVLEPLDRARNARMDARANMSSAGRGMPQQAAEDDDEIDEDEMFEDDDMGGFPGMGGGARRGGGGGGRRKPKGRGAKRRAGGGGGGGQQVDCQAQ
jgi:DnaJ family protein A protein 2